MGSIEEAASRGKYVITVDSNALAMKPGVILASFLKHIDLLVYETIIKAFEGSLPFGSNSRVGISEGMVDYTRDDPLFIKYVPGEIRERIFQWYERIKSGGLPDF
jgi:basic membrane lipoprotein Med (substrate-binding protein (PBP1-ABC) superfamily)